MEDTDNTQKEFILCAAIKWGDLIISAHRHKDCHKLLDDLVPDIPSRTYPGRDDQGFLTSHNRYVDRREAFKIAKENNQIYHNMHDDTEDNFLVSEDLY